MSEIFFDAVRRLAWSANAHVGRFVPYEARRAVFRWLHPPRPDRVRMMNIDLVGSCNLRCPSCPVGNTPGVVSQSRLEPEHFRRLLDKALAEFSVQGVALYNWSEPFLHPELPRFIEIVKEKKLYCALSTNLNLISGIDSVLGAAPDLFRVSLSGMSQRTYGETHAGGDVETVKQNLRRLAEARAGAGRRNTRIQVFFHKYRHNGAERAPLRRLVRSLGFEWVETWALLMPVEKVLEAAEGRATPRLDRFVKERLAFPLAEALDAARAETRGCRLLNEELTLDVNGRLALCCSVLPSGANLLGDFLSLTPSEIADAKRAHPTCTRCRARGVDRFMTYGSSRALRRRFDELSR